MSKGLTFADLHSHSHKGSVDRLHDCVEVLHWVFRTAAEYDCDYIFFLGDLFHERDKIDVLGYLRVFEVFMEHMIQANAPRDVYLLVGNHDMYLKHRWDVNSVKPLSAIPRVHLIDKPTSMTLGGRRIDWMPHTENPVAELEAMKKKSPPGDLLFGHMAVHGAMVNVFYGTKSDVIVEHDGEMTPVDLGVFSDWKKVKLGHYHGAQVLGNVEYIGSPLELTFGDAFQKKHVKVIDLDTLDEVSVANTFSPRHYILTPEDIREDAHDLGGHFVRMSVGNAGNAEVIDLHNAVLAKYKVKSLDSQHRAKRPDEDRTVIQDARSIMLDTHKMLETYVRGRGVPDGMDVAKLMAKGVKCLVKKISS